MGRRGKTGQQDRNEGALDKAKGRLKEAGGALTGNKEKKAEGRADQRSGTMKEKKGHLKDLLKEPFENAGLTKDRVFSPPLVVALPR